MLYPLLFCEQILFYKTQNSHHEYLSAFSSLVFSWCAIFGLFASNYNEAIWKWLYGNLFCVGFGSFALHWTHNNFSGMLDVVPMLLCIWLSIYVVLRVIICRLLFLCSNKPNIEDDDTISFWVEKIDDFFVLFCTTGQILCISANYNSSYDLPLLFGGPSIFMSILLLFFGIWMYCVNDIPDKSVFKYLLIGQLCVLLSAIFWVSTEPRCYSPSYVYPEEWYADPYWVAYLPSHALWHIGLAMGCYYEIMFLQYFDIWDNRYKNKETPKLKTSNNSFLKILYSIWPVVEPIKCD